MFAPRFLMKIVLVSLSLLVSLFLLPVSANHVIRASQDVQIKECLQQEVSCCKPNYEKVVIKNPLITQWIISIAQLSEEFTNNYENIGQGLLIFVTTDNDIRAASYVSQRLHNAYYDADKVYFIIEISSGAIENLSVAELECLIAQQIGFFLHNERGHRSLAGLFTAAFYYFLKDTKIIDAMDEFALQLARHPVDMLKLLEKQFQQQYPTVQKHTLSLNDLERMPLGRRMLNICALIFQTYQISILPQFVHDSIE